MDTARMNVFLKDIELFKDLNDEELKLLADNLEEIKLQPNSLLFSENSPRKYLYIIFDGEIELYKTTTFGE